MRIPQQVTERVKEAPAQALRAVFSGIGQVLLVADRIKSRAAEPTRAQPGSTERQGQSGQKAAAGPKDETRWRSLDETGNVRLLSDEDAPEPGAGAEATVGAEAATAAAGASAVTEPSTDAMAPAETVAPAETPVAPETPARSETPTPPETAAPADAAPAVAEPPVVAEAPAEAEPPAVAEAPAEAEPPAVAEAPADAEPPAVAEAPADAEPPAASTRETALPVPNYDDLSVASLRARLRNLDTAQVRALLDYEKATAGRAAVLTMFERRIAKLESQEA
jgi:hypothetical protein